MMAAARWSCQDRYLSLAYVEDITQDVYLELMQVAPGHPEVSTHEAYRASFWRRIDNAARRYKRRETKGSGELPEGLICPHPNQHENWYQECLDLLPEGQLREAFRLHCIERHTIAVVMRILGIANRSQVSGLVKKARDILKHRYGDTFGPEEAT